MPRHTHAAAKQKHSRVQTRLEREKHIEKRFVRAKRDGTLDSLSLYPRWNFRMDKEKRQLAHGKILAELEDLLQRHGYQKQTLVKPYGASYLENLHPEILRFIPGHLRKQVWGVGLPSTLMGGLSRRDTFYRYSCDCSSCIPEGQDGYRSRQKRL